MTEPRAIRLSIEVPGTPEEVWEAIATGPGISSWFMPVEVEGRQDGRVAMDFGSAGADTATVAAWEPPRRVVFVGGGDQPLAYEWLVEATGGGTCVVRLVNSGFGEGDDWDAQYDGMEAGWRIFLESLRLRLVHFPGVAARPSIPTVMLPGPRAAAWPAFCAALGVPPDLTPGSRLEAGDGRPPLAGRVEAELGGPMAHAWLLLLDRPSPGTGFVAVEGTGDLVSASLYLYLNDAGAAGEGDRWAEYLAARFPPPPAPPEA